MDPEGVIVRSRTRTNLEDGAAIKQRKQLSQREENWIVTAGVGRAREEVDGAE
jgi:hypothetical protein